MKEFKWNQWHHEYLGVFLIIIDLILHTYWIGIIGLILVLDGLTQLFWFGQYGGLLHELYVRTLYKLDCIKKFNRWMDKLFGA